MTLDGVDGPFRGPCGICGGPDARHRMWDAIEGLVHGEGGGEKGIQASARWYRKTPAQVRFLVQLYAEVRRKHQPLPGRCWTKRRAKRRKP